MISNSRTKKKVTGGGIYIFSLLLFWALCFFPLPGMSSASAAVDDTSQQRTAVSGVVVDTGGEPVIGASVITEDGKIGTITDVNGNFRLDVQPGTKLTVRYVGYNAQKVTATRAAMRIVLSEDSQMLDEVQIVAYGVQKKVTVTGAISGVKGDDLLRTPTSSVTNVLSGLMTGVTSVQFSGEPGSDGAKIYVRGQATYHTSQSGPLIQVDGVERDFYDIDPNEIESITILKDASATAVFGMKGANGVILVTTRRGQEGKAKISFNTSASVQMPTKMVKLANSYEYATFHNTMKTLDEASPRFSDYVVERFKLGDDPIRFPNTDWVDYVMEDATLQSQHNLNISGGTKTVRYFISVGAFTQGGLFKQFDLPYDLTYQYNRYNYRSNLDIDVSKSTKLSINIAGKVDNANKPYTGQGSSGMVRSIYQSNPFSSPGLVNGKVVYAYTSYPDVGAENSLPWVGGSGFDYYGKGFMKTSNNSFSADLILDQKLNFITKGLNMKLKGSYNSGFTAYKQGQTSVATYTPVQEVDGEMTYKKSGENTQISYSDSRGNVSRDWYFEFGLHWARDFGNHHLSALAMYNQDKKYYPSNGYADIPHATAGFVGRVTYDWKTRYMAEFNVGYNGSENYAVGRRYDYFPAWSVGWTISEEPFWKSIKPAINYMKLRASLGLVGNDRTNSRFMYTSDPYSVGASSLLNRSGVSGADPFGYYFGTNRIVTNGSHELERHNAYVTWEKSFKQNYGIDASLLKERLKVGLDYFTESRKDIMTQDEALPALVAFPSSPYANMGEVKNWGWEVSLRWDDRIGNNFRYFVGVNLSYNQNEIIEKMESPKNYDYLYQKGHRIGARSMYKFWRFYDEGTPALYEKTFGQPYPSPLGNIALRPGDAVFVDLNNDGAIDTEDMSYDFGYTDDPEYIAGINMGFSWKNFDVSMQWTGAWNVSRLLSDVFRRPFTSNSSTETGGLLKYHVDNTWTEDNPSQDSKYPRPTWTNTNNYANMTLYEVNSSYLRLKTIQVAYNFKLPFMQRMKLNSCVLAFSGYNLLTFTKYIWGDPEARASNEPTYPLQKTYSLSLKVGF